MAAPSRQFITSLYRFGTRSPANKARLEGAQGKAFDAMEENNGGSLASMSGNGLAATMAPGGMTIAEWFTALDEALKAIDAGRMPSSVALARIV
jgi:hypothetical protein